MKKTWKLVELQFLNRWTNDSDSFLLGRKWQNSDDTIDDILRSKRDNTKWKMKHSIGSVILMIYQIYEHLWVRLLSIGTWLSEKRSTQ